MFKKLCFLISFVLVLSLVSSAYGDYIIGDFEETLHYIREYQARMDQFSWSINGATLHDHALRLDYEEGENFWPFQFPLGDEEAREAGSPEFDPNILLENTHVVYDMTWYASDWIDKGIAWSKSEKITFQVEASGQEVGEDDNYDANFGNPDEVTDGPGWVIENWPAGAEKITETIAWDYSSDPDFDLSGLENPPTVLWFSLAANGGGSAPIYYDNIMLINANVACVAKPRNTQTDVPVDTDLSWQAVDDQGFDVYFGTSYAEVDIADTSGGPGDDKVYRAHKLSGDTTYDIPEILHIGRTYYWRVDKQTSTGVNKGEIWSFETQCKAKDPYPADYATGVERQLEVSWRPGFTGAYHDVYFGTDFNDVNDANILTPIVYRLRQEPNDYNYTVPEYLDIEVTYYWRIDEVNDSTIYTGDVWRFTTLSARAQNPYPFDGYPEIYIHAIKLAWTTGIYTQSVMGHDVYFGTNEDEVANQKPSPPYPDPNDVYKGRQSETEYELSNLDLNTTYYWRIDEINDLHPDHNWPGYIWSFSIPDYITIDDFNSYTISDPEGDTACPYYDGNDLRLDLKNDMRFWWLDGHVQKNPQGTCTSGLGDYNPLAFDGSLAKLPGSRILRDSGGQASYGMSYFYDNNDVNNADFPPEQDAYEDNYSEILRYYAGDGIDLTPNDKINANFRAIELNYRGDARNDCDPDYDRMFVGLEDTSGVGPYGQGHFAYIYNPDPDAARKSTWQQWAIELSDFTDENPDLDLNHIRSIRIGFGLQGNPYDGPDGGEGTVIFDDIRVFEQRCIRGKGPVGDISGFGYRPDCVVDPWDLEIMGFDWLRADETIEFDPVTAPPAPVLWYQFEETSGTTVTDSGTGGNNGTIENPTKYTWDASGYKGRCINLLGGRAGDQGTFIHIPPAALSSIGNQVTFTAWIKCDPGNPQDNWNGLFGARDADGISLIEVHCPTPPPPDQEAGPIVEWRVLGTSFCQTNSRPGDFAGQWHHYAFAKDAANDVMQIYHNGQLLQPSDVNSAERAAADAMFEPADVNRFYVGTRESRVDQYGDWSFGWFIGKVDDFQVYNKLLTPEEVAYLATDGTGTIDVPLIQAVEPSNLLLSDPNKINFTDYALLANNWLEEQLWPQP